MLIIQIQVKFRSRVGVLFLIHRLANGNDMMESKPTLVVVVVVVFTTQIL